LHYLLVQYEKVVVAVRAVFFGVACRTDAIAITMDLENGVPDVRHDNDQVVYGQARPRMCPTFGAEGAGHTGKMMDGHVSP
jgi:hypothetical protein